MTSLAIAYAATGVLAPVAAILVGFTTGLQLGALPHVLAEQAEALAAMESIDSRLSNLESQQSAFSQYVGGGF